MSMRLHGSNESKLLRSTGGARCAYCGVWVEWFDRYDARRIPLSPEVPARLVPEPYRWHVNRGIAYPGADPRTGSYCRIQHPAVCPALDHPDLPEELAGVVKALAVRMRTAIDRDGFVPVLPPRAEDEVTEPEPDRPVQEQDTTRHTISYSGLLRLGPGRLEDIQCIAALEDGTRCPNTILDIDEGTWEEINIPPAPGREGRTLWQASDGKMWVWTLTGNFTVVTRWLRQRCADHEPQFSTAPDHAPREWVEFHPLRHSEHVVTQRPEGYDPPRPPEDLPVHDGPRTRTRCAGEGCHNASVADVPEGWLCWRCAAAAKRRSRTHRRLGQGNR
jgi:hypothetical protein